MTGTTEPADPHVVAASRNARPNDQSRNGIDTALLVVAVAAVAGFAVVSLFFVVYGRVNGDEGWYLYAARLAWRGELPYADFAFTQTPLVPYVYGVGQLIEPSIYLGRLTSTFFAVGAVALCTRVAWRDGGRLAGAAVAILCLAFPTGIYNLTLVKTYAPAAFLLAAVLAALTSPAARTRTLPLAMAASMGLFLTRTSGVPLAAIVLVYAWKVAPDRATRSRVVAITAVGAIVALAFVLNDVSAARFDLATFHQLLWYGAPLGERVDTIFTDRIPEWLGDYWGYVALAAAAVLAVALSRRVRQFLREQPGYLIVAVGIVLYAGSQLGAGQFAPIEYAAAIVPPLLVVTIVPLARWGFGPNGSEPAAPWVPVVAVVGVVGLAILTVVTPSVSEYRVSRGEPGSVAAANRVAEFVADNTTSSDDVLALWGQPSAVASDRDLTPDVTLGLFSYEDLSDDEARDYHYVNQARLAEILESGRPAAVVLTDLDRVFLGLQGTLSDESADAEVVLEPLRRNYRLAYTDETWGTNSAVPLQVFLRRPSVVVE
jgi:hypothetical protein